MVSITLKDSKKLRTLIAESGNNITSFSKDVGISRNYLSCILAGIKKPSPIVSHKIAEILNVEVKDIFLIEITESEKHSINWRR